MEISNGCLVVNHLRVPKFSISSEFWNACAVGNISEVNRLISEGENDFNTGLMAAIYGKQREIAHIMISHGARKPTHIEAKFITQNAVAIATYIKVQQIISSKAFSPALRAIKRWISSHQHFDGKPP